MPIDPKDLILYAENLGKNIIILGEENYRTIISRAFYSAYLRADNYVSSIHKFPKNQKQFKKKIKTLIQNTFMEIYEKNIDLQSDVIQINILVEQINSLRKGNHLQVSDYFKENGEEGIADRLMELKKYRVKADYKLQEIINPQTAKLCCEKSRIIIEMIDRLKVINEENIN